MTTVHFQATFLPKVRKFKVELNLPKERWVELMTIAHFLRWARATGPLKIGGIKVRFCGNQQVDEQVREYFRAVAERHIEAQQGRKL